MNKNRKEVSRIPSKIQYSAKTVEIKNCHVEHLHARATPLIQAGGNINIDLGEPPAMCAILTQVSRFHC